MKKDKKWLLRKFRELTFEFQDGYLKVKAVDVVPLIDQLDEPEKVVIPKFVADWWEHGSVAMYGEVSIDKKSKLQLISNFNDRGLSDHLSKVEDWIDENESIFLDLVNGKPYEVEKEKLYQVIIPTKDGGWEYYFLDHDGGIDATHDLKRVATLTESFIKSISDGLWQFAVEVAE